MARYGIGAPSGRRSVSSGQTPPTNRESGSGGAGVLGVRGVAFSSAGGGVISDLTTGRLTLSLVNIALVTVIGFYLWTRSSQGG